MGWWQQVAQNKAGKKCEDDKIRRSWYLPDVKDAGNPLMHEAGAPPEFPQCYFFLRKWLHAERCPPPHFTPWGAEPEAESCRISVLRRVPVMKAALWTGSAQEEGEPQRCHPTACTHWSSPGHKVVYRQTFNEYLKRHGLQKAPVCGEVHMDRRVVQAAAKMWDM